MGLDHGRRCGPDCAGRFCRFGHRLLTRALSVELRLLRMKRPLALLLLIPALAVLGASCATRQSPTTGVEDMNSFIVIAHRGAAGYLPEHTLAGTAMAHAMGADFIEQDVVMTRDRALIVLHDLTLEAVTDVASRFPGRKRADGGYYAMDFALEEIRSLRVNERVDARGRAVFPGRFPPQRRLFAIPTLAEEIELIQGLNRSTGRTAGIYVEPKALAWHDAQGYDLVAEVLQVLDRHGYRSRSDPAYLQSFDAAELRRTREELGCDLKLVQLIGENRWRESDTDFKQMRSAHGLRQVAAYADGVGPWIPQLLRGGKAGSPAVPDWVAQARDLGLFLHAYTLRADALPRGIDSVEKTVREWLLPAGLDGVFTDHPDQVLRALERLDSR
ncbi:MAG: glycerophosphodiester phosphodiesterase [Xanthomonadales bacterium]|nr:glycerophosphodiester phosphodiesterase [Xanthomonadales bacterium]